MSKERGDRSVYDLRFTTDVSGPHVAWAKPLAGGPVKVFAVPTIRYGREFSELAQRMSLDLRTVTIDRNWDVNKWGFGDFYHLRASQHDFSLLYRYLEDALVSEEDYDVIVLPGTNGWSEFPAAARRAIIDKVRRGTGLILLHPFSDETAASELASLSPLVGWVHEPLDKDSGYPQYRRETIKTGTWCQIKDHFITSVLPWDALPYDEMGYYEYQSNGDVLIAAQNGDPIVAVRTVGKGRVVGLGYFHRDLTPQHIGVLKGGGGALAGLYDTWGGAFSDVTWPWWECFYALIARSLVWACGREPAVRVKRAVIEGEDPNFTLGLDLDGDVAGDLRVDQVVRDEFDTVLGSCSHVLTAGSKRLEVPVGLERVTGGRRFVSLWLRSGDEVLSWGMTSMRVPHGAKIRGVEYVDRFHMAGEPVEVMVQHSGEWVGFDVELVDEYGRVTCSVSGEWTEEPLRVRLETVAALTLTVRARASLRSAEGDLLDMKYSPRFVLAPRQRDVRDFEVLLVQQNRGRGDLVALARQQMIATGITGGFVGDRRLLAPSGARGLGVYWYHRARYVARKEKYALSKDKAFLVREPCLNDTEFLTGIAESVRRTVSKYRGYNPISYYAQDEGSLTCYSDALDLCFCSHCLVAFRKWLRNLYGDLVKLNEEWGTSYASWDTVVPFTANEARQSGRYAAWADHRTFMEDTYVGVYALLRNTIRAVDPEGRVRMSGCQQSVAHNGCDYSKLHEVVEYFEAYQGGDQYEFHRSFAKPNTVVGGWFGYGVSGDRARHSAWHGLLHGLTLMNIFWEYAWINPDFTPSNSALDFGGVFREIKGSGIGKLLLHSSQRDHCGIAIHYSYASIHATWIEGKAEQYKANRHGWVRVLENLGLQFNFVARQHIEAGALLRDGYRVLVLPLSMAISAAEAECIKAFVAAGGSVIADYRTGVMNEHCTWQKQGCLDELFGLTRLETRWDGIYRSHGSNRTKAFPDLVVRPASIEETEVRGTTAQALFTDDFSGHCQGVLVRSHGEGKTVYLNHGLESYSSGREGEGRRNSLGSLFAFAGVRAPAAVLPSEGETSADVEVFYYQNGEQRYTAVLHAVAGGEIRTGSDGVVLAGEAEGPKAARRSLSVRLATPAHLYDMRRGTYLGYCNRAPVQMGSADIELMAQLPYRVARLEVSTNLQGRTLQYSVRLCTADGSDPGIHVFHVELLDPVGNTVWYYAHNVEAPKGKVQGEFLLALNDPEGKWALRVRDAATGMIEQVSVQVGAAASDA